MKRTPGAQAKQNAYDLSNLLNSKKISKRKIWVNAVVALINPNFKILNPPEYYFVKHSSELSDFIINFTHKIDKRTINNVVNFLQDYSNEILFRKNDAVVDDNLSN